MRTRAWACSFVARILQGRRGRGRPRNDSTDPPQHEEAGLVQLVAAVGCLRGDRRIALSDERVDESMIAGRICQRIPQTGALEHPAVAFVEHLVRQVLVLNAKRSSRIVEDGLSGL